MKTSFSMDNRDTLIRPLSGDITEEGISNGRNIYMAVEIALGGERRESGHTINVSGNGAVFLGRGDYLPGMRIEVLFPGGMANPDHREGVWFRCPAEVVRVEHFKGLPVNGNGQLAVEIKFRDSFILIITKGGNGA